MVRELNSSHGYAGFRKQCLHFFHCQICPTLKFQVRLQQKKKKELGGFYRCALNYFEPSAFPLFLVFYCALRGSLCSLGLAAAVHQGTIVILKSSVMTAVILWAGFVVVFLVS